MASRGRSAKNKGAQYERDIAKKFDEGLNIKLEEIGEEDR